MNKIDTHRQAEEKLLASLEQDRSLSLLIPQLFLDCLVTLWAPLRALVVYALLLLRVLVVCFARTLQVVYIYIHVSSIYYIDHTHTHD